MKCTKKINKKGQIWSSTLVKLILAMVVLATIFVIVRLILQLVNALPGG